MYIIYKGAIMRIKNEINYKILENLFLFTRQTWSKWKKEKRPIVELIEKSFTDEELKRFLETNEIPYKIQFANKYFSQLNNEFSIYLIKNKGLKALITTLINEENLSIKNFTNAIINQYNTNKITDENLKDFIDNKPSEQLLLYILDNKKQNWLPYLSSLNYNRNWLASYFELIILSIKKNIFDIVFPQESDCISITLLPKLSNKLLSIVINNHDSLSIPQANIVDQYNLFLEKLKIEVKNDTYNDLFIYDNEQNFDLNIKPVLKSNNEYRKLKDSINEDDFNIYKFESNKN